MNGCCFVDVERFGDDVDGDFFYDGVFLVYWVCDDERLCF